MAQLLRVSPRTPMNMLSVSVSNRHASVRRLISAIAVIIGVYAASSSLLAQAADAQNNRRRTTAQDDAGGDRRNLSPQDMQARMLTALRERLEVPDDEEWKVISERLTKVTELQRNTRGGGFGGFGGFTGRGGQGGPTGGDSNRGTRGTRGTTGGSTEMAALSAAIRDKLPDAEIKARLDRVRETRKENEVKLSKAQEELRAVLSVRQEAAAVTFGLLP